MLLVAGMRMLPQWTRRLSARFAMAPLLEPSSRIEPGDVAAPAGGDRGELNPNKLWKQRNARETGFVSTAMRSLKRCNLISLYRPLPRHK